ncbi:MAG TPA: TolC family protein [Parafilimonas sp.]|nr:TolC family protein [Parafilimonas sp.]
MKTKIVCILYCCFCCLFTQAQQYSLEDCFALAKKNNYSIRQSRNATASALLDKQAAVYNLTPAVSINADHIFSSGKSIDPVSNLYVNDNFRGGSVSADAVIGIFNGLQKMHSIQQASYQLKSSEQGNKRTEITILSGIVESYAKVLYNKEKVALMRSNNELTKNELAITKEKIEVGKLSKSEYYTINARMMNEAAGIIDVQNDSSNALLDLEELLGLTWQDSLNIVALKEENIKVILTKEIAVNEFMNHILRSHPALRESEFAVKASEQSLQAAKGSRWPVLSLEGSLLSNYNASYTDANNNKITVEEQLKNNFGSYVGIVLEVPLFQQMKTNTLIKKEKINLDNANLSLQRTEISLRNNVQQMVNDFYAAKKRYEVQYEALQQGMHSYEVYEEKHKLGMANALELISIKDYLNELQSKYLDAKYSLFISAKLIDVLIAYTNM